jgi:hypothetical protein
MGVNIIMDLKIHKRKNKKRNIFLILIAIIVILGNGISLYKSYANYIEEESFEIIKGLVPKFKSLDIEVAYTVNGEKATSFPTTTNYSVDVDCGDTATVEWDYDEWFLKIEKATADRVKCSISFTEQNKYTEEILNGADPVVNGSLIPVMIADGTDTYKDSEGKTLTSGTVIKADTAEKWYSYENKEWANAIILKDETKTYETGATIPEDNIESYFVWIPKYSYQLWNLGEYTSADSLALSESVAKEIQIKFGTTNTSDSTDGECTTPLVSGESGNCKIDDYMTHPAFINANTNGLWVGKFEIGYDGAASTAAAQVSIASPESIIVKPNVYSWRNNTIYNFFLSSYYYKRDLDSHMMKNTEWGAVAYLSYSAYGIDDEIWINNNSNFVTGCVGDSESATQVSGCANPYNSSTGYNGSTTGNITGIYDMSGGAWEYMAAYIDKNTGNSGFISATFSQYAKYLDVYNASSEISTYQYRILGDATGEMGPFYYVSSNYYNNWFQDYSHFVDSSYPWFKRGGDYSSGSGAGQFAFGRYTGVASSYGGARLVLSI